MESSPYQTLPDSIKENYRPPFGESVGDQRPAVIRVGHPSDRRIEVTSSEKKDVYIWDAARKGWFQIG